MDFFRRLRPGSIVGAVLRHLEGPPPPPAHIWVPGQAWARLRTSTSLRGSPDTASGANSMLDDVIERALKSPYRFELEVHRPGRPMTVVVRQERVPGKVEGTLFLSSNKIPAGAEVPLVETGPGPDDFRLDWDAFLAIPHQADRLHLLRDAEARAALARNVPPGARENSVAAIHDLARSVAAGLVSREVFDRQARDLRSIGYLDDANVASARSIIDQQPE